MTCMMFDRNGFKWPRLGFLKHQRICSISIKECADSRFSSVYMMLCFEACLDCLRHGSPYPFLVPLGASVGTENVLNFCSDDEDSALDPSDDISFTPCGVELLRLV
jgi:hypothetical protein